MTASTSVPKKELKFTIDSIKKIHFSTIERIVIDISIAAEGKTVSRDDCVIRSRKVL